MEGGGAWNEFIPSNMSAALSHGLRCYIISDTPGADENPAPSPQACFIVFHEFPFYGLLT